MLDICMEYQNDLFLDKGDLMFQHGRLGCAGPAMKDNRMFVQNTKAPHARHEGATSVSASLSSMSAKGSQSTHHLQKLMGLSPQVQRMRRFQQMANQRS